MFSKIFTSFRVLEAIRDSCLQVSELASAVVTNALERVREYRQILYQVSNTVGELNLATGALACALQSIEYFGSEQVAANNR